MNELDIEKENVLSARDALMTLIDVYIYEKKHENLISEARSNRTTEDLEKIADEERRKMRESICYALYAVTPLVKKFFDKQNPRELLFESAEDYNKQQSRYDKYLAMTFSYAEAADGEREPFFWKLYCPECANKVYLANDYTTRNMYCPYCGSSVRLARNVRRQPSEFLASLYRLAPHSIHSYNPRLDAGTTLLDATMPANPIEALGANRLDVRYREHIDSIDHEVSPLWESSHSYENA